MTRVFSAPTRTAAWLAASEYLLGNGETLNVILDIESPGVDGGAANRVRTLIDAFYQSEDAYAIHTVAETIFPGWEYRLHGLKGVYERYPAQYAFFKKGDSSWGRYAYRMIHRIDSVGNVVNPLDRMIRKMKWANSKRGIAFRACYELGILDGAYELPLYDGGSDGGRLEGAPCLTHLSFKLVEGKVHLTALYRNHDYRYKVPGNLLGLARLQACVANETGAALGTLVVHSTRAFVDKRKGKRPFAALVAEVSRELAPNH
ncbi:MAG: hypothetical protein L3K10_03280 [Thermoplasmata archaeon]|nr:hypothetical protein [Thermoplasmata archaeon]